MIDHNVFNALTVRETRGTKGQLNSVSILQKYNNNIVFIYPEELSEFIKKMLEIPEIQSLVKDSTKPGEG